MSFPQPETLLSLPAHPHLVLSSSSRLQKYWMDGYLVVWLLLGFGIITAIRRYRAGRFIRKLRGPPSPSFLLGKWSDGVNHSAPLMMRFRTFGSVESSK